MPKSITQPRTRLVLIDAHAVLHRAYHALPPFSTADGTPTGALYGLATMLTKLINDLKPDRIAACYDVPEPTHRHEVYDEYKSGRAKSDDELVTQLIASERIFEAFSIPVYKAPGFEADDLLGTAVEQLKNRDDIEIVIASGDMDTMQLVDDDRVKVYTMKKGIKETVLYDEEAMVERFGFTPEYLPDYKGLAGDSSDNIPGIKGIGEKTATSLIQQFGHLEDIYAALEKDRQTLLNAGVKQRIITMLEEGKDEAEFSKMLATIRRDAPATFELGDESWMQTLTIETAQQIFREYEFRNLDQRLAEAVGEGDAYAEASREREAEVSEREKRELAIMLWLIDSNVTSPDMADVYNATNTNTAPEAREVLEKRLKENNLTKVFEKIERPIISIIEQMQKRGIKIDRAYLSNLSEKYHAELNAIEKKIYKDAGREFNINSPQQLADVLFDDLGLVVKNHKKTTTGKRSTAESELQKLAGEHPVIDRILEHRELSKLLSTYIDAIPPLLDEQNVLHAEFLQAGTTTGRMASQNPNIQNIPIRSEYGRVIRDAFVAREGYQLVAFDYSQIELRIASFLSEDEKLMAAFREGQDIHTAVASEVFEVAADEVDKEMRRKAKVINFGILYGMGVQALQRNLGTDRKEAQAFYNDYFEKFSGLAAYIEVSKNRAHEQGYTETYFGRRRYFKGLNSSVPYIRAGAERMAVNAPVQGTGADILKIAMHDIDRWIEENAYNEDIHCLLQVHDELIYEVRTSVMNEATPAIWQRMENVLTLKETNGVPLKVEAEAGKNWGTLASLE